jgi:hypothetical protein
MMVSVSSAETPERPIVSHDYAAHLLRNRSLPCIILTHAASCALLQ